MLSVGASQYFVLGDNRPTSADQPHIRAGRAIASETAVLPSPTGRARFGPITLPAFDRAELPHPAQKPGTMS